MNHETSVSIDGTLNLTAHTDLSTPAPRTTAPVDPSGLITVLTAAAGHVFEHQPADEHRQAHFGITSKAEDQADGTVKLIWAIHDEEPGDFNFLPGYSFREFGSSAARDEYVERHAAIASYLFLVDRYDRLDGTVDYRCSSIIHKTR